jgi:multidrug efflux system membrane fusion protein
MIDLSSGTILIKASISNENKKLWPGDFVHVNLLLDTVKDATVVPFDAIQIGQKGEFVFVVKPDMTIEVRQVTLGEHYGDQIVISDGIKPGEKVVTDGQINLRAGTKVVEKKAGETPAVDQPAGKP